MKHIAKNFGRHLLLFLCIEIIFVLLLFREFPETNFITMLGLLHTSYWIILVFAGWLRERMQTVRKKALSTYLPVVYHLFIHMYAGRFAVDMHVGTGELHDEHEFLWITIGVVLLGILIFVGEYLLHRKLHCDSHHAAAHATCHDPICEGHCNK